MLGLGLIKGLVVTARNFIGSFYDRSRFTTIQYPEERRVVPENNRSFPFLVYDGTDEEKGLRCVSCKICEKECPPQCIYIVNRRDERGKPLKHPEVFDIDLSVCMSCQICVEVCPFDSIKMDQAFEYSESDRFARTLIHKKELSKSNEYYYKIRPQEAAASDARMAAEKAQQDAKNKAAAAAAAATSSRPASSVIRPPAPPAPVVTTPNPSPPGP
jgi:NADH-quinone oxidoreductase subunit I